jgi:acyl-CoA reductase-like NAD-dependent aldehyde dehydrogenase
MAVNQESLVQGMTLVSLNPATGDVVGELPVASPEAVNAAVARARAAQPGWAAMPLGERVRLLAEAGPRLIQRLDELARLLTTEMGKPYKEARAEIRFTVAGLEETLSEIEEALAPERLEDAHTVSTLYHDPFGVCAAISPWNFPVAMPNQLAMPALAAGNAVVLKPSEETPLIAQAYVDLLNESLPENVLQIVHGADATGRALVAADVDLIAFTGSRETGKKILEAASGDLKRVILELGGKDPMIVLDDADIEAAAKFAVMNSFRNAGQVCVSTERIYVDRQIAEQFENRVAELTGDLVTGDGLGEGTDIGPMINARQREHVVNQVETALSQGAKVLAGGNTLEGNYYAPTVLGDIPENADIMREETFGPVACIVRFDSEDDAVRLANDTPFGLGAVVFGDADGHAPAVARRLDAGMIGINKGCGGASGSPWVGAKQSGYGFHSSKDGHRQFTQHRVVSVPK